MDIGAEAELKLGDTKSEANGWKYDSPNFL